MMTREPQTKESYDPKLTGLEEICKSALTRKDLNPRDREFWKERLAWVKNQQKAEDGSLIEEEVGRVGED